MSKVFAFVADGSEEVELLAVVDVLVRGGQEVKLVSVSGSREVVTAHHVRLTADYEFSEIDCSQADLLFLPGGMPGTTNMAEHEGLCRELVAAERSGKRVAAICAAPSILGKLGLLRGKTFTCYPGFEKDVKDGVYTAQGVVTDGRISTARGLGFALDLGLELLGTLDQVENANKVKEAIQYD